MSAAPEEEAGADGSEGDAAGGPDGRWERRRTLDLITHQLGRWQPGPPVDELRTLAAVIAAGIDGLTEAWLTTRDDEAGIAAATLFASRISALVEAQHRALTVWAGRIGCP